MVLQRRALLCALTLVLLAGLVIGQQSYQAYPLQYSYQSVQQYQAPKQTNYQQVGTYSTQYGYSSNQPNYQSGGLVQGANAYPTSGVANYRQLSSNYQQQEGPQSGGYGSGLSGYNNDGQYSKASSYIPIRIQVLEALEPEVIKSSKNYYDRYGKRIPGGHKTIISFNKISKGIETVTKGFKAFEPEVSVQDVSSGVTSVRTKPASSSSQQASSTILDEILNGTSDDSDETTVDTPDGSPKKTSSSSNNDDVTTNTIQPSNGGQSKDSDPIVTDIGSVAEDPAQVVEAAVPLVEDVARANPMDLIGSSEQMVADSTSKLGLPGAGLGSGLSGALTDILTAESKALGLDQPKQAEDTSKPTSDNTVVEAAEILVGDDSPEAQGEGAAEAGSVSDQSVPGGRENEPTTSSESVNSSDQPSSNSNDPVGDTETLNDPDIEAGLGMSLETDAGGAPAEASETGPVDEQLIQNIESVLKQDDQNNSAGVLPSADLSGQNGTEPKDAKSSVPGELTSQTRVENSPVSQQEPNRSPQHDDPKDQIPPNSPSNLGESADAPSTSATSDAGGGISHQLGDNLPAESVQKQQVQPSHGLAPDEAKNNAQDDPIIASIENSKTGLGGGSGGDQTQVEDPTMAESTSINQQQVAQPGKTTLTSSTQGAGSMGQNNPIIDGMESALSASDDSAPELSTEAATPGAPPRAPAGDSPPSSDVALGDPAIKRPSGGTGSGLTISGQESSSSDQQVQTPTGAGDGSKGSLGADTSTNSQGEFRPPTLILPQPSELAASLTPIKPPRASDGGSVGSEAPVNLLPPGTIDGLIKNVKASERNSGSMFEGLGPTFDSLLRAGIDSTRRADSGELPIGASLGLPIGSGGSSLKTNSLGAGDQLTRLQDNPIVAAMDKNLDGVLGQMSTMFGPLGGSLAKTSAEASASPPIASIETKRADNPLIASMNGAFGGVLGRLPGSKLNAKSSSNSNSNSSSKRRAMGRARLVPGDGFR